MRSPDIVAVLAIVGLVVACLRPWAGLRQARKDLREAHLTIGRGQVELREARGSASYWQHLARLREGGLAEHRAGTPLDRATTTSAIPRLVPQPPPPADPALVAALRDPARPHRLVPERAATFDALSASYPTVVRTDIWADEDTP